ncbi:MAG: HD domain-containing protein [Lachnospiraceae bacterium]|nr:HD domain-containing protein [Lachnospiraceae bacterium]
MFIWYYLVMFIVAVICSGLYLLFWRKSFFVEFTVLYVLIPIVNMGYYFFASSRNTREALLANKIIYVGGCYLLPVAFFATLSLCQIRLKRWIIMILITFSTFIYAGVLSIGSSQIFYKEVRYSVEYGTAVLEKEYGPMHTLFYVMEIAYVLAGLVVLIITVRKKKKDVSMRNLLLLFLSQAVTLFAFFFGRMLTRQIEWMPFAYAVIQILFLVILDRICLYDIADSVAETLVERGAVGFVKFDFDLNFLNCNETALNYYPELGSLKVDKPLSMGDIKLNEVERWIRQFEMKQEKEGYFFEKNGRFMRASVDYFTDGRKKRGYQVAITDETREQEYERLVGEFNDKLMEETNNQYSVSDEILDELLVRVSDLINERGASQASHAERIRHTTELIVREIQSDPGFPINDEFCEDLIRGSVLYDIGKIAVSDKILKKPGRLNEDEFEAVKQHPEEGDRIINLLLEGVQNDAFLMITRNAALCHHERWDGTGYPKGLRGIRIPLEARIIAIADVYDALVSSRCYKKPMTYKQAYETIMGGMGTQFDKNLGLYFERASKKIEEYYSLKL